MYYDLCELHRGMYQHVLFQHFLILIAEDFQCRLFVNAVAFAVSANLSLQFFLADYKVFRKAAVFAIELKALSKKELPELNDAFAEDVSEFATLDEYKANILSRPLYWPSATSGLITTSITNFAPLPDSM